MLFKNVTGIMRRTIIVRFVTLCCLFAEICGSSQQLSPQTPQKLVSHVKSSPAEEFMPRWVKTNPKTLHVEPLGAMVCNRILCSLSKVSHSKLVQYWTTNVIWVLKFLLLGAKQYTV